MNKKKTFFKDSFFDRKLTFEEVIDNSNMRPKSMVYGAPWFIENDYEIVEDFEDNPYEGFPTVSFQPLTKLLDRLFDIKEDRKTNKKRWDVYGQFQKIWWDAGDMDEVYTLGGFSRPKNPLEIKQDLYFYDQFIKYFKNHRARYNLVQAYEYYKKKLQENPLHFGNPENFRWEAFSRRPPGRDEDFTSFKYSGRVGHEVRDLYDKYNVKEKYHEEFLRKLANNREAPLYDQELARHVLKNIMTSKYYRMVNPKLRQLQKLHEINEVKRDFYHRATPHDLEMIRKIKARNKTKK